MERCVFYRAFYDYIKEFPKEVRLKMYDAIFKYAFEETIPELKGEEKGLFNLMKFHIDISNQSYKSGVKGGRPRKEKSNDDESKDIENNEQKVDSWDNTVLKEKKKSKRFVPPTAEEVNAYCRERKNNIDGQYFVDFYTSKGWKIGSQSMKDWRAAVRTWERNNKFRNNDREKEEAKNKEYEEKQKLERMKAEQKEQQAIQEKVKYIMQKDEEEKRKQEETKKMVKSEEEIKKERTILIEKLKRATSGGN